MNVNFETQNDLREVEVTRELRFNSSSLRSKSYIQKAFDFLHYFLPLSSSINIYHI